MIAQMTVSGPIGENGLTVLKLVTMAPNREQECAKVQEYVKARQPNS